MQLRRSRTSLLGCRLLRALWVWTRSHNNEGYVGGCKQGLIWVNQMSWTNHNYVCKNCELVFVIEIIVRFEFKKLQINVHSCIVCPFHITADSALSKNINCSNKKESLCLSVSLQTPSHQIWNMLCKICESQISCRV